jgi:SsrA-binding protein
MVNKKARHNYVVLDRMEAGIALLGTEVKSLRDGQVSLDEAFARLQGEELFLLGCHIKPYSAGSAHNHDPLRPRKLLLHRQQIRKLASKVTQKGQTLVPLAIFFNKRGLAKVDLALVRGKTKADKRDTIRERDARRDMQREPRR